MNNNKMKEINTVFMAVAAGNESVEVARKLYAGVAPVYVLAINPSKAQLGKLFGKEPNEDPVYIKDAEIGPEGNKITVPQVRFTFVVKTDPKACNGIEMLTNITFFLNKYYRYNRDNTKVEVVNKYGEFTWLPIDCIKNNAPIPDNMKWYDTSNMRPAFMGEEELTNFIKAYLVIPNKSYRNPKTGETEYIPNLADAEAQLDHINDYFKGNISEIKDVISARSTNRVNCMFGVKTTDDGKQYQAVYTHKFLKLNNKRYESFDTDLQGRKAQGSYANVEFSIDPLHEYKVEATDFSTDSDPLGGDEPASPWDTFNK